MSSGRFDNFQIDRFTVEVNVPGFDVRKSISRSNKQKQKKKLKQQQQQRCKESIDPPIAPSPQPKTEPVVFGTGDPIPATGAAACPTFRIEL